MWSVCCSVLCNLFVLIFKLFLYCFRKYNNIIVLACVQYAPHKKGSKLSKARRAKQLGLESAALALIQSPQTLDLRSWVKPDTEGTI